MFLGTLKYSTTQTTQTNKTKNSPDTDQCSISKCVLDDESSKKRHYSGAENVSNVIKNYSLLQIKNFYLSILQRAKNCKIEGL